VQEVAAAKQRARSLLQLGRKDDAADVLRDAVALDPDDYEVYCLLALALRNSRPADASAAGQRAMALRPEADWPHRIQAQLLLDRRRNNEAFGHALRAVELAPQLYECHLMMAQVLGRLGRIEQAMVALDHATSINPNRVDAFVQRSKLAIDAKDWRQAQYWAEEALRRDPNETAALNNLAVAKQGMGQEVEAVELFAHASAQNPNDQLLSRNAVSSARRMNKGARVSRLLFLFALYAVLLSDGNRLFAVSVLTLGLAAFGTVRWLGHRAATERLPPHLREFARRERRQRFRDGAWWLHNLGLRPFRWQRAGYLPLLVFIVIYALIAPNPH
jgi:tetratricopeptide (TPR) repeat protein